MRLRTLGFAMAAGIAAFGLAVVAVVELVIPDVYFSLLVALPIGLVAGAVVAAVVLLLAGSRRTPTQQALAYALGTFGTVLLVVVAVLMAVGLPLGMTVATAAGTILGLVAGAFVFVRRRERGGGRNTGGVTE